MSPVWVWWNSVNIKPPSVRGRRTDCQGHWSQISVYASILPSFITVGGNNAKLIIQPLKKKERRKTKQIYSTLSWDLEAHLKGASLWGQKYFYFSCFDLLSFHCYRQRVCSCGERGSQKEVEKYLKCLICCCTWNLVSIIYIVRFSTVLCPVFLQWLMCSITVIAQLELGKKCSVSQLIEPST